MMVGDGGHADFDGARRHVEGMANPSIWEPPQTRGVERSAVPLRTDLWISQLDALGFAAAFRFAESSILSSGDIAGALSTAPSGANCEPWHGQSQHCSVEFQ